MNPKESIFASAEHATMSWIKTVDIPRSIKLCNNKAPSISVDVQKCNVTECSNQADIKSTVIINLDDTPSGIAFDTSDLSTNLCLCTWHYKHQHQKSIQCTTCNELLKLSELFNWHYPNPTVIGKYLKESREVFVKIISYATNATKNEVSC